MVLSERLSCERGMNEGLIQGFILVIIFFSYTILILLIVFINCNFKIFVQDTSIYPSCNNILICFFNCILDLTTRRRRAKNGPLFFKILFLFHSIIWMKPATGNAKMNILERYIFLTILGITPLNCIWVHTMALLLERYLF